MNFVAPAGGTGDLPACPEMQPPVWLKGGHLQTIFPALFGQQFLTQRPSFRRERLATPDGDFLDLDWLVSPTTPHAETSPTAAASALLVLFHGLEGSSESPYAQFFGQSASQYGWAYVVVHFRGCSGEINQTPRAYHSGDYAEIDWILSTLASRLTSSQALLAVGISLGGNALMRWAGEKGHTVRAVGPRVHAAAAISSPLDLAASGQSIDQGLNRWLYARHFLRTMVKKARAKHQQYPGLFDLAAVERATTLRAFDDAFTAPLHGFADVDDYWKRASAKPMLPAVAIPALIVNACNDPFVPQASLPTEEHVGNRVSIWRPQVGGHVGFPSARTMHDRSQCALSVMPQAVCHWLAMAANLPRPSVVG
jgi:predicted alpha/beta-fold hydrolase